jgi:hypothetical protein
MALPATSAAYGQTIFTSSEVNTTAETIDFGVAHGLIESQPISITGGDVPAGLVSGRTYYARVVNETTIQVLAAPESVNPVNLTDGGTGDHTLHKRQFAKFVLLTNYGAGDIVFRAQPNKGYTIADTDIEALLPMLATHPYILNVSGCRYLATRAIGSNSDLCIIPLDNS